MQDIEKIRAFCHAKDDQQSAYIFNMMFSLWNHPDHVRYLLDVLDKDAISRLAIYTVDNRVQLWTDDVCSGVEPYREYSTFLNNQYRGHLDRAESKDFQLICIDHMKQVITNIEGISDERIEKNDEIINKALSKIKELNDSLNHGNSNSGSMNPFSISGEVVKIVLNHIRACTPGIKITSPDYIMSDDPYYVELANSAQIFMMRQWRYMCSLKVINERIKSMSKTSARYLEIFDNHNKSMEFYKAHGAFDIKT